MKLIVFVLFFIASQAHAATVSITWPRNADDIRSGVMDCAKANCWYYRVYWGTSVTTANVLGKTVNNTLTVTTDKLGVKSPNTICIRIRAVNKVGMSDYSKAACIKFSQQVPVIPNLPVVKLIY